jgi:hypothetical protein
MEIESATAGLESMSCLAGPSTVLEASSKPSGGAAAKFKNKTNKEKKKKKRDF